MSTNVYADCSFPKGLFCGCHPFVSCWCRRGVSNSIPWVTHLKGLWFSSSLPLPHPCQRREQLAVVGLPKGAFGAATVESQRNPNEFRTAICQQRSLQKVSSNVNFGDLFESVLLRKEEALANAQERHRSIAPSGVCVAGDEGTMVTMGFVVWICLDGGNSRKDKSETRKETKKNTDSRCLFGKQAINIVGIHSFVTPSESLVPSPGDEGLDL